MWTHISAIVAVLTVSAPTVGAAQSVPSSTATYTWLGEFVSADPPMTMTVKPRMAYPEAVVELRQFKAGDPVWVVWSGINDYSEAVRQVRRAEAGLKIDDSLVLPAEFVSAEPPQQYVTIRVKVPQSSMPVVKAMKPGQWISVTSHNHPATDGDAVVTLVPYGANKNTN